MNFHEIFALLALGQKNYILGSSGSVDPVQNFSFALHALELTTVGNPASMVHVLHWKATTEIPI